MPDAAGAALQRVRRNGQGPGVEPARVDVAFTPAGLAPSDVAVVVDVLRATSTVAQALASGYRRVRCCETLEAARAQRAPGRVLAGERGCVKPAGFALGNSPAELAGTGPLGDELVLATTNGTPAIAAACRTAPLVLLGSLLNLDAVARAIPPGGAVALVCSGTDGTPALEDVYAAGRLVALIRGERSDAARMAYACARSWPAPAEPLAASANGARLRALGQEADVAWCARESTLDVVPVATGVVADAVTVESFSAGAVRDIMQFQ